MGQTRLKWGQVRRYFEARDYDIRPRGGERIIVAPADGNPNRQRQSVVIGHTSCANDHAEVLKCYESALKRAFGVTSKEIRES